uniref:Asp_Arg_Hydrox domain-containing protein n=1 Tax=Rhodnius prolixus TaxID=13249 RepID=T1HC09_RHOPR
MDKFTVVLTRQPKSPRALYGVARALDLQAEAKSSNIILDRSIDAYMAVIRAPQVPDELFRRAAERLINRLRFRGQHMKAVPVHRELINRFNNSVQYRNDLAINYLMVNRLEEAGAVFRSVLERWPQDPMARSHYGLVLKLQDNCTYLNLILPDKFLLTTEGRMKESIPHLLAGISTDDLSTRDARLYFHVGDALARTGQKDQAMKIYEDGVAKGLFRSKYQRSLYNVDRLAARPWWTQSQTQYQDFFRKLEENWKQIKEEGMKALKMKGLYQDESESLRDSGDWKQFELYARGVKFTANCNQAPVTCSLIDQFPPARTCKRGQTKFSVMSGGTHVWPHCGPTNCRLRAHLGLVVPKENIAIRVAEETRKWEEGKVLIFDDSFEHEVWHNGTSARLVLIVDIWHPDLTAQEIRTLSPI